MSLNSESDTSLSFVSSGPFSAPALKEMSVEVEFVLGSTQEGTYELRIDSGSYVGDTDLN